jgi:hypothetical protein
MLAGASSGFVSSKATGDTAGDIDDPLPGMLVGADLNRFEGVGLASTVELGGEVGGIPSDFFAFSAVLEDRTGCRLLKDSALNGCALDSVDVLVAGPATARSALLVVLLVGAGGGFSKTSRANTA